MLKTVLPVRLFTISAPFLFLLWLMFVGTFALPEMLIGIAASLAAAFALCVVERAEPAHFRPRLRDLAQLVSVPWLIIEDTYEVLQAALRDLFGGRKARSIFRVVRFHAGDAHDPADTARRFVVVVGTTMSPNSVVLGINNGDNELVLHQIENRPIPPFMKNLGAGE